MAANNAFQQEFALPKKWWHADPYDNQSGEIEYEDEGLLRRQFDADRTIIEMHKNSYNA